MDKKIKMRKLRTLLNVLIFLAGIGIVLMGTIYSKRVSTEVYVVMILVFFASAIAVDGHKWKSLGEKVCLAEMPWARISYLIVGVILLSVYCIITFVADDLLVEKILNFRPLVSYGLCLCFSISVLVEDIRQWIVLRNKGSL